MTAKEKIKQLIAEQPNDATYDEIMRELAFSQWWNKVSPTPENAALFPVRKWGGALGYGGSEGLFVAPAL